MEEHDLSIITGLEGYDSEYSPSEFIEHLKVDLSSEKYPYGCVLWRAGERYEKSEYELYNHSKSTSYRKGIKQKTISVLEHITCHSDWRDQYMVQFWAAKVEGRHHYLTTSDQPFSLGSLCKGICWYRKLCMDHRYVVEERANEEQLGAVGRVYRNKHPESSPDLRLYSTKEFPLQDYAARCGFRSYFALPVFDLLNKMNAMAC